MIRTVKIATFNINNVNKRLANLLPGCVKPQPDVVALQELKAADREFPRAAIEKAGYGIALRGQKTWNGVAILARGAEPIVTRTELPGDPKDDQSRYIEAAVNGVIVTSLYAPNGNPQPGPKFTYKLAWMERLLRHAAELHAAGVPVVLAGDYNVVPTDKDIYPTKSYADNALVQPEPRALFQRLLGQGWTDAIRTLHTRTDVHVLGLFAEPMAARCRVEARPSAAESGGREAAGVVRRRSRRARRRRRERSCSGLDHLEGSNEGAEKISARCEGDNESEDGEARQPAASRDRR